MSAAPKFSWKLPDRETELHLFDHAPVGVAQCEPEGNITALSPVLEQMLAERCPKGRPLYFGDLIHPDDKTTSESLLQEMFDGRRDHFQLESRSTVAAERALRWTAWRVTGTDGRPDYALALAEEVQESRATEQRLHQAQRLEVVGRLAGGVAHDFNNLLTGILLYCDLLLCGLAPGDRTRKYAEEIRSASIQASGLVRQLLTVVRPTSSEPLPLSLNETAESMRHLLLRLIGDKVQLEFHLDPDLGLVRMDQTQAQQILLNLVLNARDAMPGGGQITIETSNCTVQVLSEKEKNGRDTSLPCVMFAVEDNGSGMDDATRAHLFEAFFSTKGSKGTGLGLATVHHIVTSSGGLIHVDSACGRGTRMSVLLPIVAGTAAEDSITGSTRPTNPKIRSGVQHT